MASIFKHRDKWRAMVRRKDQPAVSEVFGSKAEAVRWARGIEADLDRAKATPAGLRTTLGAIIDAYLTSHTKGMGTTKQWNLYMLRDRLGHLRLDELTKSRLSTFFRERAREGAGPATNGQTLMYLKVVLRYGGASLDADEAVAEALTRVSLLWDAMRHSGEVRHSAERNRRPSEQELVQLMDHFDTRPRSTLPMTDIMLFAICTAMRQGEILSIVWEDFDEGKRTILVRGRKDPTTPGGRDMEVPLIKGHVRIGKNWYDPVEIMLRQISARRRTGRIFPYASPTIINGWRQATQSLAIPDLTFHDLRHDGVSRMFEAGYDIPQVAAVSGHKSWKNLQRYTQIRPEAVQRRA